MRIGRLVILSVTLASCVSESRGADCTVRSPRFAPYEIRGLEPRPVFWKVRPDEIVDFCKRVTKCSKKEVICHTSLGYPVYALYYGTFTEDPPQTNWSAGQGSTTYRNYTGRPTGSPQTFLLLAGVHGSEPENVAATMNLLQMLETGRDFRGKGDPRLLELISKYRLIVVPCLNMDGRAISPDHLRGVDWDTFRRVSQGVWKDGTRIGWRGSKAFFPLPLDRISFPGGYPNADGYNIMHDAAPGDLRTDEARSLLKLVARWRVDFILNCHSHEWEHQVLRPSGLDGPDRVRRGMELRYRANTALYEMGLVKTKPVPVGQDEHPGSRINLNNLMSLASGALALTLESSVSYDQPDRPPETKPHRRYSFEELMEPLSVVLKELLTEGLESPFVVRGEEVVYPD